MQPDLFYKQISLTVIIFDKNTFTKCKQKYINIDKNCFNRKLQYTCYQIPVLLIVFEVLLSTCQLQRNHHNRSCMDSPFMLAAVWDTQESSPEHPMTPSKTVKLQIQKLLQIETATAFHHLKCFELKSRHFSQLAPLQTQTLSLYFAPTINLCFPLVSIEILLSKLPDGSIHIEA